MDVRRGQPSFEFRFGSKSGQADIRILLCELRKLHLVLIAVTGETEGRVDSTAAALPRQPDERAEIVGITDRAGIEQSDLRLTEQLAPHVRIGFRNLRRFRQRPRRQRRTFGPVTVHLKPLPHAFPDVNHRVNPAVSPRHERFRQGGQPFHPCRGVHQNRLRIQIEHPVDQPDAPVHQPQKRKHQICELRIGPDEYRVKLSSPPEESAQPFQLEDSRVEQPSDIAPLRKVRPGEAPDLHTVPILFFS